MEKSLSACLTRLPMAETDVVRLLVAKLALDCHGIIAKVRLGSTKSFCVRCKLWGSVLTFKSSLRSRSFHDASAVQIFELELSTSLSEHLLNANLSKTVEFG